MALGSKEEAIEEPLVSVLGAYEAKDEEEKEEEDSVSISGSDPCPTDIALPGDQERTVRDQQTSQIEEPSEVELPYLDSGSGMDGLAK